jgi:hypothetical protein
MDEETEELPPIVEPRNEHAEADAPAEIPASAEEPEAVPESGAEDNDGIETLTPEEFVEKYVNGVDASSEEATSPKENEQSTEDSEEDEEFLHPINPIKAAKLPSDQKLRELISRTGDVFRFLIDKLVFTGLMRESTCHTILFARNCISLSSIAPNFISCFQMREHTFILQKLFSSRHRGGFLRKNCVKFLSPYLQPYILVLLYT